jgi:multiple sugar transport system substrate-binding protein
MKINKILLIILILLIAVTASSCNESEKLIDPIEIHLQVPFDAQTPFAYSDNPSSALGKIYQDAASNFHELNPQIKVIIDYNTDYMYDIESFTNSIKLLESDETPDIVPIRTDRVSGAKELLWDLLKLQKSSESNEIDIDQQILDSAMVDGKLLTLPYSANPQVMLYNKEIFDAAHITYPQNNWTWEDFRGISKKLKGRSAPILSSGPGTFEFLLAGRKALLSPSGDTTIGYMDSPEAIRTLLWLNGYYRDLNQTTFVGGGFELDAKFNNNSIAMFISSYGNEFPNFQGSNKAKLGVAPIPHFADGERASQVSFDGFGISQKSKHPEAAWKFINYLTLTKNEDSVKFAERILTTSRSLAEATGQSTDPIKSIYMDEMNYTVKSSFNNPLFLQAWNSNLQYQFIDLISADDKDIPANLHNLTLGVDQEMKHLKQAEDQQTESSSP